MKKRFKLSKSRSKRMFRKTAGVKGRNFATGVRGGYRL